MKYTKENPPLKSLLHEKKGFTIAVGENSNPYLMEEARRRNWRLINLVYLDATEIPDVQFDGAIMDLLPTHTLMQQLQQRNCPIIRLGRLPHPEDDKVLAVLPDRNAEGTLAAEHFYERGFQHVGYVGRAPWGDHQTLYESFRDRAAELGMECHLNRFKRTSYETRKEAKERKKIEFMDWIRDVPKPFGLLASGEVMATVYCFFTMQAGVDVPSEVAVLSRGNSRNICEASFPTISSCDHDEQLRVHTACERLDQMIREKNDNLPKTPIMISPKGITERESTHVLATPDRLVSNAVRFMWENLDQDINVEDIAAHVSVSSRQLTRRFQAALNRTVANELRRKRLEQAQILLRNTNLLVADIAEQVGFHSSTYLHQVFRATFKMTPAKYRRLNRPPPPRITPRKYRDPHKGENGTPSI